MWRGPGFMANIVVYELLLTRRTEDITQEFYRTELNYLSKLQNSNLKNVTSSLQRINNAVGITSASHT